MSRCRGSGRRRRRSGQLAQKSTSTLLVPSGYRSAGASEFPRHRQSRCKSRKMASPRRWFLAELARVLGRPRETLITTFKNPMCQCRRTEIRSIALLVTWRRPGSIPALDTGRSLSSGRTQRGPVGRYDGACSMEEFDDTKFWPTTLRQNQGVARCGPDIGTDLTVREPLYVG